MAVPQVAEFRLVVTGGGTGGHIYPALAVVDYLRQRHPRLHVTWVGSERMESRIVPRHGLDFHLIDIRFSYRRLTPDNFKYYVDHVLPIIYGKPFRQARHALQSLRPQLVLATGGYVSAPVLRAAQLAGIPYALLQIDARPGLVNWFFADRAWRVYVASQRAAQALSARCSARKLVVSGCPAAQPTQTPSSVYQALKLDRRKRLLVAMGGSLGAAAIDRLVWETVTAAALARDPRWHELAVVHVIGRRPVEPSPPPESLDGVVAYRALDYVDDVPSLLAAASFYLGRSGAAAVGELAAAGLPAFLVPDPQHSDRQQLANAEELAESGIGTIGDQQTTRGTDVLKWLASVWDAPKQPVAKPAAAIIGDDILKVAVGA